MIMMKIKNDDHNDDDDDYNYDDDNDDHDDDQANEENLREVYFLQNCLWTNQS